MKARRIFTVLEGTVTEGAAVEMLRLSGAGIQIPAIIIGEEGRGRKRGVLPVAGLKETSCPDRGKDLGWSSVVQVCRRDGSYDVLYKKCRTDMFMVDRRRSNLMTKEGSSLNVLVSPKSEKPDQGIRSCWLGDQQRCPGRS